MRLCPEVQHTTLRTISPVHDGIPIVHRSIPLAKTLRKHIQTDASWWHFLFSFRATYSFGTGKVGWNGKKVPGEEGTKGISSKICSLPKVSLKSGVRCESTDRKLAQEQARAYRALKRAVMCLSLGLFNSNVWSSRMHRWGCFFSQK